MFEFVIKLADFCVKITCRHDYLYNLCRNYIVVDEADFSVFAEDSDICHERQLTIKNQGRNLEECYLESTAVYRKICNKLIEYDAFLFHSAVIKKDEIAIAFIGKSGAGKTTHANFWISDLGAEYINGDKPIIRVIDGKLIAYGTPWCGKEKYNSNTSAPLKAIALINKSSENRVQLLSSFDAVPVCLRQCYIPANNSDKIMDFVDIMVNNIPVFSLYCKKELEPAKTLKNTIDDYYRKKL